jgi:hypothetical protein
MVFILEAHASDEWKLTSNIVAPIKQTKTLEDRFAASQQYQQLTNLPWTILLDDPTTNAFEAMYAPWPFRLYIIDANKSFAHIAEPVIDAFDLNHFEEEMNNLLAK